MHVCLWLHLPRQDCKLCLRFSDGCNWKWLKLHSVLLLTSLLCKSSSTILLTSLLCKSSSTRQVPVQAVCQKEDLSQKMPLLAFLAFFCSGSNYLVPDNTCLGAQLVFCPAGWSNKTKGIFRLDAYQNQENLIYKKFLLTSWHYLAKTFCDSV